MNKPIIWLLEKKNREKVYFQWWDEAQELTNDWLNSF